MQEKKVEDSYLLTWENELLQLLPEKAVFLPKYKSLLIADPHFGKASHFRKSGVPVPENLHREDLSKIQHLLRKYRPESLYFLGDLFHSDYNNSWKELEAFAGQFPDVAFHLVLGNHDILPNYRYSARIWQIHRNYVKVNNLLLSHEPMTDVLEGKLNLCGHIHPGISLYGNARQKLTLPCFFLQKNQMILPAFGRFTGLAKVQASKEDRVFVLAGKKVSLLNFG